MEMRDGQVIAYHEMLSDDDLVILQIERFNVVGRETYVFDGFDSMEMAALEHPDIPIGIWQTLTEMQSELNASKSI